MFSLQGGKPERGSNEAESNFLTLILSSPFQFRPLSGTWCCSRLLGLGLEGGWGDGGGYRLGMTLRKSAFILGCCVCVLMGDD